MVLSDGSVLVLGGYTNSNVESNEVWKSNDGGVSWTLLTNNAWGTGGKSFIDCFMLFITLNWYCIMILYF